MRRICLIAGCFLAASALLVLPAYPHAQRKGKVVGAIWEYTGKKVVDGRPTGEEIRGKFRLYNKEVFRGPKKVGFVKSKGRMDATMTITDWPEMNGSVDLKQVRYATPEGDPPVWMGLFAREDGTKWRLVVKGFER